MIRYFLIIFTFFLLFTPNASPAAVYQWLDEQGNVGFTDNPDSIPEKYRQDASQLDGTTRTKKPKNNIAPTETLDTNPPQNVPFLDDNGRDEQWWRNRMQELRRRKTALLAEQERLTTEMNSLSRLGLGSIDENRQAEETKEQIERTASEIKEIEHNLTVLLPEEARKSNAPPGWLRE